MTMTEYEAYLLNEEKSPVTIEKYLRDVRAFLGFLGNTEIDKEQVILYKKKLIEDNYAVSSINSMLAAVNNYLHFIGQSDACVKAIRTQKKIYCAEEKELTKEEYRRLLNAASEKPRLKLLIQTICSTGIRVSEVKYFTVEAVKEGEISVSCKNKIRTIMIPGKMRKCLLRFAKKNDIRTGIIFRTKSGRPLDRSNIWAEMKSLCTAAKVNAMKVFPHNLRKLFARTFYRLDKDIAKLADVLGHSSIETTRIYIISTGMEHRKQIEKMGLVIE